MTRTLSWAFSGSSEIQNSFSMWGLIMRDVWKPFPPEPSYRTPREMNWSHSNWTKASSFKIVQLRKCMQTRGSRYGKSTLRLSYMQGTINMISHVTQICGWPLDVNRNLCKIKLKAVPERIAIWNIFDIIWDFSKCMVPNRTAPG